MSLPFLWIVNTAKSDNLLNDNNASTPTAHVATAPTSVQILRLIGVFSSKNSTMGSRIEIDDVNAAKVNNKKNKVPTTTPRLI